MLLRMRQRLAGRKGVVMAKGGTGVVTKGGIRPTYGGIGLTDGNEGSMPMCKDEGSRPRCRFDGSMPTYNVAGSIPT